ncbi:hypothetical protein QE364_000318 [Nocardioides zeae]|uniref:Uncharacterized protein n=2 Tax=Nocardioides zeae TaxID=1457234 RepID=A0ACC6ID94_9ACTN|nr:DUF4349 domain-containing protein [Nocardioides zeae]MDQ1104607.1 hypothetical protein [Nocardioides zeae]MDR6175701.1 hypothetical protein [Nocardioides zeae]MDR6208630.1 hypothetical protein [Nocardioides zeae]
MNRTGTLLALALTTTVALTACSSSDGGDSATHGNDGSASSERLEDRSDGAAAPPAAPSEGAEGADVGGGGGGSSAEGAPPAATTAPEPAAVIATGTIDLVADDVAETRRDVQRLADEAGGRVAGEETTTDRDGVMDGSRLELQVPSAAFDDTMTAVEEVAATASSTRSLEDVGTEIVDTEARIRAQEQSLTRIEALLAEAEDLTELVAIESELTSRQAALDSLTSQLDYLQDATSYSTITVYVERTDEAVADEETDEGRGGFLGGLTDGWDGLTGALGAVAVAVGLLLPWLLLLALVGVPLTWGVRHLRRRRTSPAATGATGATGASTERPEPDLPTHPGRP